MSANREEGCILTGVTDRAFILRLEGWLTQKSMWNMNHAVQRYREGVAVQDVLVDVRQCSYMDSTMLGLLARLALKHDKVRKRRPFLVGLGKDDLATIFSRMSLDRLFIPVSADAVAQCPTALVADPQAGPANRRNGTAEILLAHETLAELSPENAAAFALVIEILNKSMESAQPNTVNASAPNG